MLQRKIIPVDTEGVWCPFKPVRREKEYFMTNLSIGNKTIQVPQEVPQPRPPKGFVLGWKK
jgi:hypothetical protein